MTTVLIVVFVIINVVLKTSGLHKPLIYITLVSWNKGGDFKSIIERWA